MGQFFVYFCSFLVTISLQIEKSIDGMLGIQTRGRRMVGVDKTMAPKKFYNINNYWYFLLWSFLLLRSLEGEKIGA